MKFILNRIYGEAARCLWYSIARGLKGEFDILFTAGFIYYFTGSKACENYLAKKIIIKYWKGNYFDCEGVKFYANPDTDGIIIFREMRDILFPHLFKTGPKCPYYFEFPYENKFIQIKPGDLVIDAGANIGMFSALAAYKGARVIAFEPMPSNLSYLNQTAALNPGVTPVPSALHEQSGELHFSQSEVNNIGSFTGNKIATSQSIPVKCITLDAYVKQNHIKKIDFIKADIEGAERNLLNGARETLKTMKPRLAICTYHYPEDPDLLKQIILEANPAYEIYQGKMKLFAR